jgi:hypothetical protein
VTERAQYDGDATGLFADAKMLVKSRLVKSAGTPRLKIFSEHVTLTLPASSMLHQLLIMVELVFKVYLAVSRSVVCHVRTNKIAQPNLR